jgi:hypothetical protein
MKSVLKASRTGVFALGLGCALTLSAFAEEPFSAVSSTPSAAVDPQRLDRDGKPIYGFELMTETEVGGLRSLLFSIKDPLAREEARAAHRKAMDKRAAERGVKIQQ